jgi:hypothetical protein
MQFKKKLYYYLGAFLEWKFVWEFSSFALAELCS